MKRFFVAFIAAFILAAPIVNQSVWACANCGKAKCLFEVQFKSHTTNIDNTNNNLNKNTNTNNNLNKNTNTNNNLNKNTNTNNNLNKNTNTNNNLNKANANASAYSYNYSPSSAAASASGNTLITGATKATGIEGGISIGGVNFTDIRQFSELPPELVRQFQPAITAFWIESHFNKQKRARYEAKLGPLPDNEVELDMKTLESNAIPPNDFTLMKMINAVPVLRAFGNGPETPSNYELSVKSNIVEDTVTPATTYQIVTAKNKAKIMSEKDLRTAGKKVVKYVVINGKPGVDPAGLMWSAHLALMKAGCTEGTVMLVESTNVNDSDGKNMQFSLFNNVIQGAADRNALGGFVSAGQGAGRTSEPEAFTLLVVGLDDTDSEPEDEQLKDTQPPIPPKKTKKWVAPIMFDIDSSIIVGQKETLRSITADIVANREQARRNNGKWYIPGHACEIYEWEYNVVLSKYRALAVEHKIREIADKEFGVDPKELDGLIIASGAGNDYQQFKEKDKLYLNRRADVVYSEESLTGPPTDVPEISKSNKRAKK